jgi:hypothetical protein
MMDTESLSKGGIGAMRRLLSEVDIVSTTPVDTIMNDDPLSNDTDDDSDND